MVVLKHSWIGCQLSYRLWSNQSVVLICWISVIFTPRHIIFNVARRRNVVLKHIILDVVFNLRWNPANCRSRAVWSQTAATLWSNSITKRLTWLQRTSRIINCILEEWVSEIADTKIIRLVLRIWFQLSETLFLTKRHVILSNWAWSVTCLVVLLSRSLFWLFLFVSLLTMIDFWDDFEDSFLQFRLLTLICCKGSLCVRKLALAAIKRHLEKAFLTRDRLNRLRSSLCYGSVINILFLYKLRFNCFFLTQCFLSF